MSRGVQKSDALYCQYSFKKWDRGGKYSSWYFVLFVDNYYIPIGFVGITVFIYCSSYADKWAGKIKDLTKEYQRAAIRQLIDEKQEGYRMTESIEG